MQRRIDHQQVGYAARRRHTGRSGHDGVQVRLGDLVPVAGDQRAVGRSHRDPPQRAHVPDRRLDLGVHRRYDLRAVAQVELVPVVCGRVVASGDHYARPGGPVPDREREQRGGTAAGQQLHPDARPGQHGRGFRGEFGRSVPGVPAEHHPGLGRRRPVLPQPAGQSRGRGPDHGLVHPVRPGSHRATQARGTELQPPCEPVGQVSGRRPAGGIVPLGRVEQILQFGPVRETGILGDPGLGPPGQIPGDRVSGDRVPGDRGAGDRVAGGGVAGDHVVRGSTWASRVPIRSAAARPAATTSA